MADTTPQKIRAIASHLDHLSDDTLQIYIDDAQDELSTLDIPTNLEEKTQRYLAIHYATIDNRRPTSEKLGPASKSYKELDGDGLGLTEYGREVKRILDRYSGPSIMLFS